jgi:hypothetical protein
MRLSSDSMRVNDSPKYFDHAPHAVSASPSAILINVSLSLVPLWKFL